MTPLGPVGAWRPSVGITAADESLLTRFDPFFRLGGTSAPAVVTSLSVKVFGVRINQASGQGSAIIATPDGVQSSYAVGDEIMPGVKLKSVQFDSITLDRGGAAEQVYLDQSVAAPIVQADGTAPAIAPGAGLANEIAFTPRIANGQPTGLVLSPKGSGAVFASAGLKPGDVLIALNGQGVKTIDDVMTAMRSAGGAAAVTLSVERGGQTVTLSAKVGS